MALEKQTYLPLEPQIFRIMESLYIGSFLDYLLYNQYKKGYIPFSELLA